MRWTFGETRMPAKTAFWLALLWDAIGLAWIVLGITNAGPMRWNNWFNVGLGAVVILGSGHYWMTFARQRRQTP